MPLFAKYIFITFLVIIVLILITILTIYLWPLRSNSLQSSSVAHRTYSEALEHVASIKETEHGSGVTDDCQSTLLEHGHKTARVVVLFHGLTACPNQFSELAQKFYEAGYTVYIPLAPYHGTSDKKRHGSVTTSDLTRYATDAINTAGGLGDEIGVVGISGGATIATWASEYRSDITRAVLLSPFYEPAAAKAPKWQLKFLHVLYGYHLLPDHFQQSGSAYFSYYALANYDILTANLKHNPTNLSLQTLGLVTSPADDQIDLDLARSIPQTIADTNNLTYLPTTLPSEWSVDHDIVGPTQPTVAAHKDELYQLYIDIYEGKKSSL